MSTKLFITGATGYIGGDAFYAIATRHPEYDCTCLIRNQDKGVKVAAAFPRTHLVYGSLDDVDLIEQESKAADIVLSCADADHPTSVSAMVRGLAASTRSSPGYLIHTSGTSILMHADINAGTFGTRVSDKGYDDWDNVHEVLSIPDTAPHRNVDIIALGGHEKGVKTAVVCPPTIYGKCRGPAGGRGHQLYELSRCTLQQGHGIQVNLGQALWTNVHVHELSDVYVRLVEEASNGGGSVNWGQEAYFFTENGEHIWGEVSSKVAKEAVRQGFIQSDEVVGLEDEKANLMTTRGSALWGGTSRGKAIRARKLLGWAPRAKMDDYIAEAVHEEAERLGLVKHHAQIVAGEA